MDPIATLSPAGPAASPATPSAIPAKAPEATSAGLSADFDTFLKMLTAQMQNQDPLNPLDSTDFATQLATFSGVEQAIRTNDLLETLSARMGAGGVADLARWVGMEARSTAPVGFDGAPVTLAPDVPADVEAAEIVVRTEAGAVVERMPVAPGTDTIVWAGTTATGQPMATGIYAFTLETVTGGDRQARPIEAYQRVREARTGEGGPLLVYGAGATGPSDGVTALRDPSA